MKLVRQLQVPPKTARTLPHNQPALATDRGQANRVNGKRAPRATQPERGTSLLQCLQPPLKMDE